MLTFKKIPVFLESSYKINLYMSHQLIIEGLTKLELLSLQTDLNNIPSEETIQVDTGDTHRGTPIQYALDPTSIIITISITRVLLSVLKIWLGKKKDKKDAYNFTIEYPDGTKITITKDEDNKPKLSSTIDGVDDLLDKIIAMIKEFI